LRHRIVLGLLLVLTLLAVACGGHEGAPGGVAAGGDPEDPVSSTPRPRDPLPHQGGPLEVEPREGLVDARPVRFEKAVIVDDDTIEIRFFDGVEECYGVDRVEGDYRADEIALTLFTGREPSAEMCIELAVLKSVEVQLDRPVDGRRVVDGSRRRT
jgi:hypothetical protein